MKNLPLTIGIMVVSSLLAGCSTAAESKPPDGLMIEFLQGSSVIDVKDPTPEFGWIVHSSAKTDRQVAYHILVSSDPKMLAGNKADMWDSKKHDSADSINIPYSGRKLQPNTSYYWKVKTWCELGGESSWSNAMKFSTGSLGGEYATTRYPLMQTMIAPSKISKIRAVRTVIRIRLPIHRP